MLAAALAPPRASPVMWRASLLQQAHEEGSQPHAVGGELRTHPDFTHQLVKDLCGGTWSWEKRLPVASDKRVEDESGDIYQLW